ncbi:MAG: serine/threonine-protein kinase [Pirellulales bacterium]
MASGEIYLGPYRLLSVLMTGQTSQVWEALHEEKRERFAIKTLLNEFTKDREHVGYLRHEYEVGRSLDHRNIIDVYEIGKDKRIGPYIVLELFPAPNLKALVKRDGKSMRWMAPRIVGEAAAGLAHFNAQGWVHRDVKPDNFLADEEGHTRLIDFALAQRPKKGIAKLFGGRSKIQGTRSYMSPEQIRGQALDLRADVYSFGCTIHELLTGKPPFTGTSANELLTKHLRAAPPSLIAADNNITEEFSELIRSCLSKSPEGRPESMSAFLNALRTIRVYKRTPDPPVKEGASQENAG